MSIDIKYNIISCYYSKWISQPPSTATFQLEDKPILLYLFILLPVQLIFAVYDWLFHLQNQE